METRVKGTPCLKVDPRRPRPADVRFAAAVLKNGGVVALPTDTVYGLAADPCNPAAVERLYRLKGRDGGKPVACLLGYRKQALSLSEDISPAFWKLADAHWPGNLTLVARRGPQAPAWLTRGLPGIGMRMPDCPWVWALCDWMDGPLAVTSANISGHPAKSLGREVARDWGGRVELLVDGGPCPVGEASWVVDCSHARPRVLRTGAGKLDL